MALKTKFISEYGFNTPNIIVVGSDQDATTTLNGSISTNGGISAVKSIVAGGYITALGFKLQSGTSTQFLKADGTVDSTTYQTANTNLSNISGLTGEGVLRRNANNTWYLDTTTYSTTNGTVTSVSGTGSVSGLSLSGTVTSSGNIVLGGSLQVLPTNFQPQVQRTFLAAPVSTDGQVSFRAIAVEDVPVLNQNTSGNAATASKLQNTVNINGTAFDGSASITLSSSLVTDDTTLNASVYPVWTSVASTGLKSLNQSSTKFYFNPSTGTVTASSFKTPTGLSTQFLKADGSLDSNSYSLSTHNHNTVYQPLDSDLTSIAAITGSGLLKRNSNNTWSLDSTTYASTTTNAGTALPLDHGQPSAGTSVNYSRQDHRHKPTPTNYDPKIGTILDSNLPIYGTFKMSYISRDFSSWYLCTDSDDREVLYFRASDGVATTVNSYTPDYRYFQATRTDSNSPFIFGNEEVRPSFLGSGYISSFVYAGYDSCVVITDSNVVYLIKHYGNHNWKTWTPTTQISGYTGTLVGADYDIITDTIILKTQVSNSFYITLMDGTSGVIKGSTQLLFNIDTDFDYDIPVGYTTTTKTVRVPSGICYNPDISKVSVPVSIYYQYNTGVSNAYSIKDLVVNFQLTKEHLITGLSTQLTPDIPLIDYKLFTNVNTVSSLYDGNWCVSYSRREKKYRLAAKRGHYSYAAVLAFDGSSQPITHVMTPNLYSQTHTSPDASAWSKGVKKDIQFIGDRIYFTGISGKGELKSVSFKYKTDSFTGDNVLNPDASDYWTSDVSGDISLDGKYVTTVMRVDNTYVNTVCQSTGTVSTLQSGTIGQYNGVRSFSSTSTSIPTLPAGYTLYSLCYDDIRNVFWAQAYRASNPDPTKNYFMELLKYSSGSWRVVSDYMTVGSRTLWEAAATTSKNSFSDYARPYSIQQNRFLIDSNGFVYLTHSYYTVGSSLSSKFFRVDDTDVNNVIVSVSGIPPSYYGGIIGVGYTDQVGYYIAYENYNNFITKIKVSRNPVTGQSISLSDWFSNTNSITLGLKTQSSIGLSAYIMSYPITLGGYYSMTGDIALTLLPNTDNYVFLSRDSIDPNKINASIESNYAYPGFNRICVAKLTTDIGSITSQYIYPLVYGSDNVKTNSVSMLNAAQTTSSITISSLSTIDSFDITQYRSAEYLITCTQGTSYSVNRLLVLHDGISAYITEYGNIHTGNILATFDAEILSNQLTLKATPSSTNTNIKIVRTIVNI